MSYLPRPDSNRTGEDVDEIYALAADELRKALSPEERRNAFKQAMLRAYEAGVDAQREIVANYVHERPTPVPPPPNTDADEEDPGLLPSARPPRPFPLGVSLPSAHPNEPKKPNR